MAPDAAWVGLLCPSCGAGRWRGGGGIRLGAACRHPPWRHPRPLARRSQDEAVHEQLDCWCKTNDREKTAAIEAGERDTHGSDLKAKRKICTQGAHVLDEVAAQEN